MIPYIFEYDGIIKPLIIQTLAAGPLKKLSFEIEKVQRAEAYKRRVAVLRAPWESVPHAESESPPPPLKIILAAL